MATTTFKIPHNPYAEIVEVWVNGACVAAILSIEKFPGVQVLSYMPNESVHLVSEHPLILRLPKGNSNGDSIQDQTAPQPIG